MIMKTNSIDPVTAALISGAPVGVMTGMASRTHKTIAAPGSLAHVMTNDKLYNKNSVLGEILKEGAKDTLTLGGIAVGAGTAASLATGNSKRVANFFRSAKDKIAVQLDAVKINGSTIKEIIKKNDIYKKFNTLPAPAKVGLAVAAAALAIATPIAMLVSAGKSGYIEGKNEVEEV